jgi:polyhydroxyalkanoate synthase
MNVPLGLPSPLVAPTPRDVVFRDGGAELLRFRRSSAASREGYPLLLVPSMINRWYVLDLRPGTSLAHVVRDACSELFCLDWGTPRDEDRYFAWEDVLDRLARMVRAVKRKTGAPKVGLLGYCMGGTLAAIHAALHPGEIAALVNLVGPIDFAHAGRLGTMVDSRWFDASAIAAAGNVSAEQMQSGFQALGPTGSISKWVTLADRYHDPSYREAFAALEKWASDNIAFPGAAYATYIEDLYQENRLVRGEHWVKGERVDLGAITAPTMVVTAERDAICPPAAAEALLDRVSASEKKLLSVPGGHVGAVVGSKAGTHLYPAIAHWLEGYLCNSIN